MCRRWSHSSVPIFKEQSEEALSKIADSLEEVSIINNLPTQNANIYF